MPRSSVLALALAGALLPGPPTYADEGDLSFLLLLAGGASLVSGSALCLVLDDDGERYDRSGLYVGIGASWGQNNLQQKGPGGALAPRRFTGRDDDLTEPIPITNRDGTPVAGPFRPLGEASNFENVRSYTLAFGVSDRLIPPVQVASLFGPDFVGPVGGAGSVLPRAERLSVTDPEFWSVNGRVGYRCNPRTALETHFEVLGDDLNIRFQSAGRFRSAFTDNPFASNPFNRISSLNNPASIRSRVREIETDTKLWTAGVNARYFLTRGRLQPYALGGLAILRAQEASTRRTIKEELVANGGVVDCRTSSSCDVREVDSDQFKDIDLAVRFGGGVDFYLTERLVVSLEGSYVRATGRVEGYDFYSAGGGIQWRFGKESLATVWSLFTDGAS